jgi:hypothetical protein
VKEQLYVLNTCRGHNLAVTGFKTVLLDISVCQNYKFQVTVSNLDKTQGNQAKAYMGHDLPFVSTPDDSSALCWLEEE